MSGWQHYNQIPNAIPTGPAEAVNRVTDTMNYLQAQATSFTEQAEAILDQLVAIEVQDPGQLPEVEIARDDVQLQWPAPEGLEIDLGDLTSVLPAAPLPESISTFVEFTPPVFTPSISDIAIPEPPAPLDTSGVPLRPEVAEITLPVAPVLDFPVMDALDAIQVPDFAFPTLPTFTEAAPVFNEAAPNVVPNWTEPTYASENFDEVRAAISRFFAGGTGLPPAIEQAMFDRARARLDITARKNVQEAFDAFANKGFTMPPGMLVEQVNVAREENQLQANAQEREIREYVAKTEIDNMRFAVQQGLAAENILFNIFNNAAQRSFEIAKFTVEAQLQLYNAKVSLFNSLTNAYQTKANVFKVQLDAELAALDVYRLQLEAEKVRGELNLQRVQVFNARVQALASRVEVYKAEMQGAQVQADVARTQIEAYRADVQAFGERVNAEKLGFDAYKARVEGEVAKVGIYDAQARVFQSLVAAEGVKADVKVKGIQADIEKMQATTQRFVAQVEHSKADIAGKLGVVEAKARTAGLNIQFLSAQNDANRSKTEASLRLGEQQLQTNIAVTQAAIKRFEVALGRVIEEARLKTQSMQAAGQMASTLAGGAMAAQHVQASISSSASEGISHNYGWQEQASENWNFSVDGGEV
jgi:hypothetical protein